MLFSTLYLRLKIYDMWLYSTERILAALNLVTTFLSSRMASTYSLDTSRSMTMVLSSVRKLFNQK